jgi:hypothetical protein
MKEIVLAFDFGKIGLFTPGVSSMEMFRIAIVFVICKTSADGLLSCEGTVYIVVRNCDP